MGIPTAISRDIPALGDRASQVSWWLPYFLCRLRSRHRLTRGLRLPRMTSAGTAGQLDRAARASARFRVRLG
jgi:hypothetical protein